MNDLKLEKCYFPENAGEIISMCEWRGRLIVCTQGGVYYLEDGVPFPIALIPGYKPKVKE